jgi:hypothetical protein
MRGWVFHFRVMDVEWVAEGVGGGVEEGMSRRQMVGWVLVMWLAGTVAQAGGPRVYPEGRGTDDRRWAPVKDLDGSFPMVVPESRDAWLARAEKVRRQVRVTMGLWPWPTRTSLNAVIHGLRDMGDYTVEKVYFESAPGLFVTGSLYRPKGRTGRMPGVLSPHGHWSQGRFMDAGIWRRVGRWRGGRSGGSTGGGVRCRRGV